MTDHISKNEHASCCHLAKVFKALAFIKEIWRYWGYLRNIVFFSSVVIKDLRFEDKEQSFHNFLLCRTFR